MIDCAAGGCPGHGPAFLFVESAAEVGFQWDPGLPALVLFSIFELRSWRLGGIRFVQLCAQRRVSGRAPFKIFQALCSSLTLAMFGKETRLCSEVHLLGVFGRAFFVPCRFCGGDDGDGHLFWDCTFPPLVGIRENPEFHDLMVMKKSCWPRCLLWHGWLPMLSGVNRGSPWAEDPAEGAGNMLEMAFGARTSDLLVDWQLPVGFGAEGAAERVPAAPDVWTDGSLVEDKVSGVSSSGSWFFTGHPGRLWVDRRWEHLDDDDVGGIGSGSWLSFCSWSVADCSESRVLEVNLAPQAADGIHLVLKTSALFVMSVAFWMAALAPVLLSLSRMVMFLRSRAMLMRVWLGTVAIVNSIALVTMLLMTRRILGRRRVPVAVIDARRNFAGWYSVLLTLHRFFIAVSRAVVNHEDGNGTAPDPLVWSAGALPKRRSVLHAMRDSAFLPGPVDLWEAEWIARSSSPITADDVEVLALPFWPFG